MIANNSRGISRLFHSTYFIIALLLVSCNNENEPTNIVLDQAEISSFSFLASDNPSLDTDIILSIDNNTISGRVAYNGDITNLSATFEYSGTEVFVDGFSQTSGTTYNNFSQVVTYSQMRASIQ